MASHNFLGFLYIHARVQSANRTTGLEGNWILIVSHFLKLPCISKNQEKRNKCLMSYFPFFVLQCKIIWITTSQIFITKAVKGFFLVLAISKTSQHPLKDCPILHTISPKFSNKINLPPSTKLNQSTIHINFLISFIGTTALHKLGK